MAFELLSSATSEITITSYMKQSFVCCIRRKSKKADRLKGLAINPFLCDRLPFNVSLFFFNIRFLT